MITDKEINQVADDEKQKDWNDLKYADIYKDGFIDGAKWMQMRAGQVKPEVKPACETDKTQCKFCTRETTAEDFGFGKDRVCKSCLEKALANELRNMEQ